MTLRHSTWVRLSQVGEWTSCKDIQSPNTSRLVWKGGSIGLISMPRLFTKTIGLAYAHIAIAQQRNCGAALYLVIWMDMLAPAMIDDQHCIG